jgi:hypothetical protein
MELNSAIILPDIKPLDLEFGGMTTVEPKILFDNGSIKIYLPVLEQQIGTYFDTYGCVSHSLNNGIEALIDRLFYTFSPELQKWLLDNIYKNGKPNLSDRDLIVMSGTVPNKGNSGQQVLNTAKSKGLLSESFEDFDLLNNDPKENTCENYYAYSRTADGQKLADEWNKRIVISGEWVDRSKFEQASKEGVIQVYVKAWYLKDGKYYNPNNTYNHAVLMADYYNIEIFDSYNPAIKGLDSWESVYQLGLKININEKTMEKPKLENNTLVQEVETSGQFGLYLDGKILTGDKGDIALTFYMRNNGDTKGKTKPLTKAQWDLFDKYSFKGDLIQ